MDAYHLELDQDLINLAKSIQEASCKKEELVGGQKKIDKNGNGKLDADDFKKLRKEDTVEEGIEAFGLKATDAQRKKAKEDGAKFTAAALAKREKVKEEVELTLEDYTLEELEDYMMSEEFDQLDELSKGTLGSYVNKAAKEARINGMISRDFENSAERKRNPGMKAAASSLKDKYQKKAWKREDGIKTAVGKLTKEQVEEIELLVTKHGLGE